MMRQTRRRMCSQRTLRRRGNEENWCQAYLRVVRHGERWMEDAKERLDISEYGMSKRGEVAVSSDESKG